MHKCRDARKKEHASHRQCLCLEPMTYPLNFGDDPDYDSDLGFSF